MTAAPAAPAAVPRTLIIGDSHVVAIQRALQEEAATAPETSALRRTKDKNGVTIGDIAYEAFLERATGLAPGELVVSALGGQQHSLIGLVQHPQAFDFHCAERPDLPALAGHEIIPYAAMHALMTARVLAHEGQLLPQLPRRTRATVLHLAPPPPKEDAEYILQRPDSALVRQGITIRGVTPASIRLKLWTLQVRVLRELCPLWGVTLLPVPADCQTAGGFLRPALYGADATHANSLFGRRLLALIRQAAQELNHASPACAPLP
ncbi:hypothetical protein [Aquabacterium sp.]|uniref:hypothetical protein n=1 Tax=Aquabacterium sp. TaxID=1872578 RepID=UPI002B98ED2A|nr:hypothetical protein [Aquabacterium sp.]HSW07413.1 hypothetical protein [Aquabacterium sp.]